MQYINLNGTWEMRNVINDQWIHAQVPGTVMGALLEAGKAQDPYYRDQEKLAIPLLCEDYEFRRNFVVDQQLQMVDEVVLHCDGLDTLTDIYINERFVASTENMHRNYRFNVKSVLQHGTNEIRIVFHSPMNFTKEKAHMSSSKRGIEYLRKAQCMFGWDWGLVLPDSGIWRNIYLENIRKGKLEDLHVRQKHTDAGVILDIAVQYSSFNNEALVLETKIVAPDGSLIHTGSATCQGSLWQTSVLVEDPALWWPNGLGGQPLYQVAAQLKDVDVVLDTKQMEIGLRTITLNRARQDGSSAYEWIVNEVPIFAKGSNFIIEDALLGRNSEQRLERMVKNCVDSNFNAIRVWGGAYYPSDYFYTLCDRYGLLVFQDFMFACNFYPADEAFVKNVLCEAEDNVKRLRNHACIALLCGNNEIEMIFCSVTSKDPANLALCKLFGKDVVDKKTKDLLWTSFSKLFCEIIPGVVQKFAPDIAYVQSSPSMEEAGSAKTIYDFFERGDGHYYLTYDARAPYSKMRELNFNFVSEMGFQSYPSMKTINSFTLPEDRSPYSDVMYAHQKCINGNEDIEHYMRLDYGIPPDFESYVYISQVQAGEILRYSVEHQRRERGRCMGVLLWQFNDCWPVVSWSGIDYYGRWKAQQYYTKRFYTPVLISALDTSSHVELWLTNDLLEPVQGIIRWQLRNNRSEILEQGELEVTVPSCTATSKHTLDFSHCITPRNKGEYYLTFSFQDEQQVFSSGTLLFVKAKDFRFLSANLSVNISQYEDGYEITIMSDVFAKAVSLDLAEADCIFSDNFFDLSAGETKSVKVAMETLSINLSLDDFNNQLATKCLNDISYNKKDE